VQAYLTAKGEFLWYPLKDKVRRAHVHTHTRTHTHTHHTHARTQHTRTHSGAPRMWKRALDQRRRRERKLTPSPPTREPSALGEWVIRGRSSLESAKKKARRHILWVLAGTQYSDPNFESLHQF